MSPSRSCSGLVRSGNPLAASRSSTVWTSTPSVALCSPCWARTAPASRPWSRSSRVTTRPTRGPSRSTASHIRCSRHVRPAAWAWPSSSRSSRTHPRCPSLRTSPWVGSRTTVASCPGGRCTHVPGGSSTSSRWTSTRMPWSAACGSASARSWRSPGRCQGRHGCSSSTSQRPRSRNMKRSRCSGSSGGCATRAWPSSTSRTDWTR